MGKIAQSDDLTEPSWILGYISCVHGSNNYVMLKVLISHAHNVNNAKSGKIMVAHAEGFTIQAMHKTRSFIAGQHHWSYILQILIP